MKSKNHTKETGCMYPLTCELGKLGKVGKHFQLKNSPHNIPKIIYKYIIYIKLVSWVLDGTIFYRPELIKSESWKKASLGHPTFQLGHFLRRNILIYMGLSGWKTVPTKTNFGKNFQLGWEIHGNLETKGRN